MLKSFRKMVLDPYPLRTAALNFIKKHGIGSYEQRLRIGAVDRPAYGY